jgi:hypothetical protein
MRDIEQELEQQGYPKHNDLFEFAAVLMATIVTGPDVEQLATFTGYSLDFVKMIAVRLSTAEMWGDLPTMYNAWSDPEQGGNKLFAGCNGRSRGIYKCGMAGWPATLCFDHAKLTG